MSENKIWWLIYVTLKTFERKLNHMKILKTFVTEIWNRYFKDIFLKKSKLSYLCKNDTKQMISSEFHHFFLMMG